MCVRSLGLELLREWLEKRQRKGSLSPVVFAVRTSCFGGCACVRRAESEIRGIKKPPHPPARLGAFPVFKFKEALQVGVLSTARGAWLHCLVSSPHGQVSVVADLILCFIGCKGRQVSLLSMYFVFKIQTCYPQSSNWSAYTSLLFFFFIPPPSLFFTFFL